MDFFEKYTSNSLAGSSNQLFFEMQNTEIRTGRIFYKIFKGGTFGYSLLFSNTIDSTFDDGSISQCNLICDTWEIIEARVGKCSSVPSGDFVMQDANSINERVSDFVTLKFSGNTYKLVTKGELFCSDEFQYSFEDGDFLCLEITFKGTKIPYHEESLLPIYNKTQNGWQYCKKMPIACMIGCNRNVEKKVAYLGDSITQGIGTPLNSYSHWNSLLSDKLGYKNAYWNLGIGFGRASDLASDGSWLYKAKQNDIVVLCIGVNDIMQGCQFHEIICDLERIVDLLKKENVKVVLQTIPPFDYTGFNIKKWLELNLYIKKCLSKKVDGVFDVVPCLCESTENTQVAKYGGHPNIEGCKKWAEELYLFCLQIKNTVNA